MLPNRSVSDRHSSAEEEDPPSTKSTWEEAQRAYACVAALPRPTYGGAFPLLDVPSRREPIENENRIGHTKPFSVSGRRGNQNILALCAQVCGRLRVDDQRCNQCVGGRGLWRGCVVSPAVVPGRNTDPMGGACACCYYNGSGSRCSFVTAAAAAVAAEVAAAAIAAAGPLPPLPPAPAPALASPTAVSAGPEIARYMELYMNMPQQERAIARVDLENKLVALLIVEKEEKGKVARAASVLKET